jgi:hypothetical protein
MRSSCFFAIFIALVGIATAEWRNVAYYTDPACATLATVTSIPADRKCSDYPAGLYNGSCIALLPVAASSPLWSKTTCGALTAGANFSC